MFSVVNTIKEAIELGMRQFWLLLVLSVIAAIPGEIIVLTVSAPDAPITSTDGFISIFMSLVAVVADSMKTAAVLGVLKTSLPQPNLAAVVFTSIRTYTWPLIRLSILLGLITFAVTIPIGCVAAVLLSLHLFAAQVIPVLVAILYLIFIKYALANPLIVVENMRARIALKKSWAMTKGPFWYVLGCYVFLGAGEYSISSVFAHFVPGPSKLLQILFSILTNFGESLWILTAWCMYLRIRDADKALTPKTVTELPPEPPSASQSA